MKFTVGKISSGHFWHTTPPPPPSSSFLILLCQALPQAVSHLQTAVAPTCTHTPSALLGTELNFLFLKPANVYWMWYWQWPNWTTWAVIFMSVVLSLAPVALLEVWRVCIVLPRFSSTSLPPAVNALWWGGAVVAASGRTAGHPLSTAERQTRPHLSLFALDHCVEGALRALCTCAVGKFRRPPPPPPAPRAMWHASWRNKDAWGLHKTWPACTAGTPLCSYEPSASGHCLAGMPYDESTLVRKSPIFGPRVGDPREGRGVVAIGPNRGPSRRQGLGSLGWRRV